MIVNITSEGDDPAEHLNSGERQRSGDFKKLERSISAPSTSAISSGTEPYQQDNKDGGMLSNPVYLKNHPYKRSHSLDLMPPPASPAKRLHSEYGSCCYLRTVNLSFQQIENEHHPWIICFDVQSKIFQNN